VRNAQRNPAIFRFNENTALLQVRQKAAFGFVISVGDVVAYHYAFPSYWAFTCHGILLKWFKITEKREYIEK
jgi:hypothetical protein